MWVNLANHFACQLQDDPEIQEMPRDPVELEGWFFLGIAVVAVFFAGFALLTVIV